MSCMHVHNISATSALICCDRAQKGVLVGVEVGRKGLGWGRQWEDSVPYVTASALTGLNRVKSC